MEEFLPQFYSVTSFLILFVFIFFIGKLFNDFLTPYNIDEQLTKEDNHALAISISGYFLAIVIIFIGALIGPVKDLWTDVVTVGGYSILGLVLLNLSRFINDKLILRKFSNIKEIIEDRNAGVGAVQFGSYIASGLIIAGAIHGEGGGIVTAISFFFMGQIFIILFTWIYDFITPFDLHKELEEDNVAAGVAFGGTIIALGIILMSALSGKFIGWKINGGYFLLDGILGFILLPIFRIFFDKLIIPKSDLNHEIKNDRNLGAAFLEITIAIGFATILFFVLKD